LIVDGRVFVLDPGLASLYVYALRLADGSRIWQSQSLGAPYQGSLAYDDGQVFTLNDDGLVTALDPATGTQVWQTRIPGVISCGAAPTAAYGLVVVGCEGTVYALDQRNGTTRWYTKLGVGNATPLITETSVVMGLACYETYEFSIDGKLNWHHAGTCTGGSGLVPALIDNVLFIRNDVFDPPLLLDPTSGQFRGTFTSEMIPAGGGGNLYFVTGGKLTAGSATSDIARWSFAGDSEHLSAPIVVGHDVVVGSLTGILTVLDDLHGTVKASVDTGHRIEAPDERGGGGPFTGLAEAEGRLLVPGANFLTAY
jgi:outer membrane protein assembly factor BamB